MLANYIKAAVENKDIVMVRSIVLKKFNLDRKREKFESEDVFHYAEKELKKSNSTVLVADDGESEFSEDKGKWDKELWQKLRIELEYNFSQMKFDRIIAVMKYLRAQGDPDFQVKVKESFDQNRSYETQNNGSPTKKIIGYGIAGGVVGGAVGLVIKHMVPGIAVGVVIGLTVGAVINRKNKDE